MRGATLLSAALGLAGCSGIVGSATTPPAELRVVPGLERTALIEEALAGMVADGEYHGALFVSADGNAYSWRVGTFSVADASLVARTECEVLAAGPCRLAATLTPVGGDTAPSLRGTLQAEYDAEFPAMAPGTHAAIWVMPTGANGYGWEHETLASAGAFAEARCKGQTADERRAAAPEVRNALEVAGAFTCRPFDRVSK